MIMFHLILPEDIFFFLALICGYAACSRISQINAQLEPRPNNIVTVMHTVTVCITVYCMYTDTGTQISNTDIDNRPHTCALMHNYKNTIAKKIKSICTP